MVQKMILENKVDFETLENLEILISLHSKASDFYQGHLLSLEIKEISLDLGRQ